MSAIKPWIGFVTLLDADHEDVVRVVDADPDGLQGMVQFLFTGGDPPKEYKVPQGITAGIVVATGEGVPTLEPGSKIYYAASAALTINDVKIVAANYILAYEDPQS